jgi:hypothetical protein
MKESVSPMNELQALAFIKAFSQVSIDERREKLDDLEGLILQEEQAEIPVKHCFTGGMYSREVVIPKDALLTGRIHKFDHFDIMLSGDITVSTDNGEVKRLTGLNIMEGKAGKKRAGFAHEETHWITFHSAEERDPEEMYEFLTCGSFQELDDFNLMLDNSDYQLLLQDMNMTEKQVREVVDNENDMIELGLDFDFLEVAESKIQGKGLFSKLDLLEGNPVCPSRVKDKRTIAGRYTNHSFHPNCKMVVEESHVMLVATKFIAAGQELTVNYREVFDERASKGDL